MKTHTISTINPKGVSIFISFIMSLPILISAPINILYSLNKPNFDQAVSSSLVIAVSYPLVYFILTYFVCAMYNKFAKKFNVEIVVNLDEHKKDK